MFEKWDQDRAQRAHDDYVDAVLRHERTRHRWDWTLFVLCAFVFAVQVWLA